MWDGYNPHPELELTEPEIVFVAGRNGSVEPFNPRERITSGLQEVVAIFGGHVEPGTSTTLNFVPLVRSPARSSGIIDKGEAFRFNPFGMRRRPQSQPPPHAATAARRSSPAACHGKRKEDADQPDQKSSSSPTWT